jgi:hypothetical protein
MATMSEPRARSAVSVSALAGDAVAIGLAVLGAEVEHAVETTTTISAVTKFLIG